MSRKRYYFYDDHTCSFAEVKSSRSEWPARMVAALVGGLVLASAFVWLEGSLFGSPSEIALRAENRELQHQLSEVDTRLQTVGKELAGLSSRDQNLYRTLLQTDLIPEDVRRVGAGGTDDYARFDKFKPSSAALMRRTAQQLDQLERQINLQNVSYRELGRLTAEHSEWLREMPAIIPADGPVVSGYGVRRHPILRVQKMHAGIDVVVREGTPVVAAGDGVIRSAGPNGSFGIMVELEHPSTGYSTVYAHLSKIPDGIKPGVKVKRGERIGLSGSTGRSTGPHVHYEVRDAHGQSLNPLQFVTPSMTPRKYRELLKAAEESEISLD